MALTTIATECFERDKTPDTFKENDIADQAGFLVPRIGSKFTKMSLKSSASQPRLQMRGREIGTQITHRRVHSIATNVVEIESF